MWLLSQEIARAMASATPATTDQAAAYSARRSGAALEYAIENGVADIPIVGVLTPAPDFLAELFGGGNTTYPSVIAALRAADADPRVQSIVMSYDSPGGTVSGLFDTLAAIENVKKPLTALVVQQAASAAYAMASKANAIYASNPAVSVGSIGVVREYQIDESIVSITSTNAPNKRPDVTTDEGRAAVTAELDALHALFVESIAAGRKTDVKTVNTEFGRGSMVLAGTAITRGMIDGLAVKPAGNGKKTPEARAMDKATLYAQHRAVFDAVLADGVASERDRVCAHLAAAKTSGLTDDAYAAIEKGEGMTETLRMRHMMAAVSRRDLANFSADTAATVAAAAAADTSAQGAAAKTDAEKVADAVAEEMSGGSKSWLI